MSTFYQPASTVNTTPALRLIRDEDAPPYDGQAPRQREPFVMISHEVFREYAAKAGPIAWSVFTCLLYHADADGGCFPSHTTIAREIGMKDRRAMMTALSRLADIGMIAIENRRTATGAKTSSYYKILVGMHVRQTHKVCAFGVPPHGTPNAHELEPLNNNHLTTTGDTPHTPQTQRKRRERKIDPRFAEFYDVWPKKVARQDAERAWLKLAPDDDLCAVILERAALLAEVTPRDRLQFVPNPATFLNGRRWEDAPPSRESPEPKNGHASNLTPAERSLRNIDRAFAQMGVPDWQPAGDVIDVNGVDR